MGDVLSLLETDHRLVERLLDALAESEPGSERETMVEELVASLQVHMRFEEDAIYPLLEPIDAEMEQEAENEHTLARDGLAKLRELIAEPGFGAAVEMLKGGINHHVEDEETEAFPKLREHVDAGQLEELSARLLADKRAANVLGDELAHQTKEQLLEAARQLDVDGRSSMSADELREAVMASAS